jgi:hypothetical protein
MDVQVEQKLLFAADFTKRYPDRKAALCFGAKQAVEELESKYK